MTFSSLFKSIQQGVVTTFEDAWNAVAHIFSNDVEPFLKASAALIERNGGSLLLTIAAEAVPDIATSNWTALTASIVEDVKAAGATTVKSEEQLAASTALQMAQATAADLTTAGNGGTTAAPAATPPAAPPASTSTSTPAAEPEADPNAETSNSTPASIVPAQPDTGTASDAQAANPATGA